VRRDITRTLLVVAEQPQLWAAIRDRLDGELALVRHARPEQLDEVWRRADPWPWLVVGAARQVPEDLASLLVGKPIPVLWLGWPDGPLPPLAAVLQTWRELSGELDRLDSASAFGLAFAPRRGLRDGARGYIGPAPELEGLLAAHPRALPRFETIRRARRTIERYALGCRLQVDAGGVQLSGDGA
jgi:hypothetical protein